MTPVTLHVAFFSQPAQSLPSWERLWCGFCCGLEIQHQMLLLTFFIKLQIFHGASQ